MGFFQKKKDVAATENRKLEWIDEEEISNGQSNEMHDAQAKESDGDDESDDDDDELADERMTIENAHVEEKSAAIEALGDIVDNCM